jgi:peptidoglycan/LPS O-acetylase OafA/YrhL
VLTVDAPFRPEPPDQVSLPNLRKTRNPGLDGIRALAVLAVIGFHFRTPGIEHGYIGVDMFFTLSGFLITGLFYQEFEQIGTIRIKRFLGRRVRRLWPEALCLVVAAVVINRILLHNDDPSAFRAAVGSLLQVENWRRIHNLQLRQSILLDHMWSLSVEEQFYLVWPFIVAWALRPGHLLRGRPLRRLGAIAAILFAASWTEGLVFRLQNRPNDRIYLGSDTRAAQLLFGALLFCTAQRYARQIRNSLVPLVGAAALVFLGVLASHFFQARRPVVDSFGIMMPQVCVGILLLQCVLADSGPVARFLGLRPLAWFGRLSYGIYLWHVPLGRTFEALLPGPHWFSLGLSLVATVIAAMVTTRVTKTIVESLQQRFFSVDTVSAIATSVSVDPAGSGR